MKRLNLCKSIRAALAMSAAATSLLAQNTALAQDADEDIAEQEMLGRYPMKPANRSFLIFRNLKTGTIFGALISNIATVYKFWLLTRTARNLPPGEILRSVNIGNSAKSAAVGAARIALLSRLKKPIPMISIIINMDFFAFAGCFMSRPCA
ncbi:MAG: hypothetical protein IH927_05670 [Proteobacteria bacterium]|nr:hypothetical protein [Pseudomonadota bacterium]